VRYAILLSILFSSIVTIAQSKKDWVQMFNGKNLDGWHVKIRGHALDDNFGKTFGVKNGAMTVNYDAYDKFGERFGHIFYKDHYSYYRMRIEYRFVGKQANEGPGWAFRNSGIMVHGQAANTMGVDQDFPISIEVQLLGGNGKDNRTTSNLCTPGTHVEMDGKLITSHCVKSHSKTYHGDQWVTAEIVVLGDSLITHYVNNEEVMHYEKPQVGGGNVDSYLGSIKKDGVLLTGGSISLQSESHPIEFRKVEILDLVGCMDPKAKNYKSYFVKGNKSLCSY